MASAKWDSLRREAKLLESTVDGQLAQLSAKASAVGTVGYRSENSDPNLASVDNAEISKLEAGIEESVAKVRPLPAVAYECLQPDCSRSCR